MVLGMRPGLNEIRSAVASLDRQRLLICHTTSAYPCRPEELNLRMIETLRREFDCPILPMRYASGTPRTIAARTPRCSCTASPQCILRRPLLN